MDMHVLPVGVYFSPLSTSPNPALEQLLGVLAKSVRAAGFLFSSLRIHQSAHIPIVGARKVKRTYFLLICFCLNSASFLVAGLRIASEGLIYVPDFLCDMSAATLQCSMNPWREFGGLHTHRSDCISFPPLPSRPSGSCSRRLLLSPSHHRSDAKSAASLRLGR